MKQRQDISLSNALENWLKSRSGTQNGAIVSNTISKDFFEVAGELGSRVNRVVEWKQMKICFHGWMVIEWYLLWHIYSKKLANLHTINPFLWQAVLILWHERKIKKLARKSEFSHSQRKDFLFTNRNCLIYESSNSIECTTLKVIGGHEIWLKYKNSLFLPCTCRLVISVGYLPDTW